MSTSKLMGLLHKPALCSTANPSSNDALAAEPVVSVPGIANVAGRSSVDFLITSGTTGA